MPFFRFTDPVNFCRQLCASILQHENEMEATMFRWSFDKSKIKNKLAKQVSRTKAKGKFAKGN